MQRTKHSFTNDMPNIQLDRNSDTPLWMQLKQLLLDHVIIGNKTDSRIPSESELCERFGVSRTVVREALNELVFDQVIYKVHGKGTFVSRAREETESIESNLGFFSEMTARGRTVTAKVLAQYVSKPSEREARMLKLKTGHNVVRLIRILSLDGQPRALVKQALPSALVPGLERANLENRSLLDEVRRRFGLVPAWSERWVEAVVPDETQAHMLRLQEPKPLLGLESCSFLPDDTPFDHNYTVYRSDLGRLYFKMK